ncbi:hypothetical protein [Streptomyces ureilyticus]|uniref:Secreted protein n=1 Tax=Streptomyces ureilyticus TaxID=1775131 RepID=A0ABX0DVQ5_9ACTN|nr:hypothetical protein [Streptomyces ureilyticus]NGO45708.1 hypothetical protein [Streptomyces ureilyticus]
MAKRRFKNKKVRYVAIGAALTTGAAVATVVLPSANAAEEKTAQEIITMCERTKVLNGKKQSLEDFGGHGIAGPGFQSDSCKFVETGFETFNGPKEKVTVDFPNCEANSSPKAEFKWTATVGQGEGKYTATQQGAAGGLFGALSGSWLKHKGTTDITVKTVTAGDSETRQVPEGKVLHMEFTPRMQRMTGEWQVKINAREATTTTNAVPEQNYTAPEVIEGPVVLPKAAGAPGVADGALDPVETDC